MKRREFIALVGGAAAWPLAAHAQQRGGTIPRIGIIDDGPIWQPFKDGLREAGYVVGQTIAFETRTANGNPERLQAFVATGLGTGLVAMVMALQAIGLVWMSKLSRPDY